MEAILSTRAAVLAALRSGPSYGSALMRTLGERAAGAVHPRAGTMYLALSSLMREGWVRSWTVVPGDVPGGRRRRYYELTASGIDAAERQREVLLRFLAVARPAAASPGLRDGIRRTAELSAFAYRLQAGLAGARRPT